MRLGYKHSDAVTNDINDLTLSVDAEKIVKTLANDPFITQKNIAKLYNFNIEYHKKLIEEIRSSDTAQHNILYGGVGTKYWTNTIMPLLKSDTLQSAIERRWMYPNRVGLYTGLSCMFYCGFCGRNPVAKYENKYAEIGRDYFYQIIDQDPKTDASWQDRFRISGGLEPLTNPYLGDIITYGSNRGYNMQLYTNGNMMTPRYLDKHPGMLDLEAVRFSLYGVDEETAYAVTKNRQSFTHVINNIIEYKKRTTKTKVGINWIILPGHASDVKKLLDIVNHINERCATPIDFVTLREDFSQNIRTISDAERNELMEIFKLIDDFKQRWTTHFDLGYALEPLKYNKNVGSLRMINWDEIVPESFPQVSVAADVKGNVYVYHESGFLDRPGSDRYIIGNITDSSIETITKNFVNSGKKIRALPQDVGFLDAFDHVISLLINQARDDAAYGIDWANGPVRIRT
jgi:dTDP-4-amino-4,6-dideoxy-D-glucose ammonia-lyase